MVCTNSDTQGRCALTIFFKDKKVAEGRSPVLEHPYGKVGKDKEIIISDDVLINLE